MHPWPFVPIPFVLSETTTYLPWVLAVPQQPTRSTPKNMVVFGEGGVGKSSLINLIAGQSVAATSSSAKGCTFQHKKYELQVDDTLYAIWDTAGLDEGTYGTVPAEIAEENLKRLLRELTRANGIHLLVYCVRASRLRQTLLTNYNLFYSAICRKKVPIVVVVTGLENYEQEMGDWWDANEAEFTALNMHFDGHACVTTLDVDRVNSPVLKQRCQASRQAVLDMIRRTCAHDHWGTEQDGWVSAALGDVRAMFRPTRRKDTQVTTVVALYDLSDPDSADAIGSAKDALPFEGARLMDAGGPLLVHRIHSRQLRAGVRFKKQMAPRGADLLVFCASVHGDVRDARTRAAVFYESYGGEMRPLLIVVKDAPSDEDARAWWNAVEKDDADDDDKDGKSDRSRSQEHHAHDVGVGMQAIVRALPLSEDADDAREAIAKLQRTIQMRSLQPFDVVPSGCFSWLFGRGRPPKLRSGDASSLFAQGDGLTIARVWIPWHAH